LVYAVGREGLTVPASPAPFNTVKSAANVIGRINEIDLGGESGASNPNRAIMRRSTTDGVTPVAQTPAKTSSSAQAAQCTSATSFTTNPTLAAAPGLWSQAINAFGGIIRWVAAPGQELLVQGATAGNDEIGLYFPLNAGVLTGGFLFEEI
jgi:hypothetical protein